MFAENGLGEARASVLKRWMTHCALRSPLFCSAPFTALCCTGAHDAGTFGITSSSELAHDLPDTLKKIPSMLNVTLRRIVSQWSRTQDSSFLLQCEQGVRYFDVRCSPCVSSIAQGGQRAEKIHLSHGSVSIPLSAMIAQLLLFYDETVELVPKPCDTIVVEEETAAASANLETLVVDLQHCTGFHPHHWLMLEEEVLKMKHLLVSSTSCDISSPLKQVWASNGGRGRIFLLAPPLFIENHLSKESSLRGFLFPRNDLTIRSDWKNQRFVDPLTTELQRELAVRASACPLRERVQLHVLQAVLTPTATDIVDALLKPHPISRANTVLHLAQLGNPHILRLWESVGKAEREQQAREFFDYGVARKLLEKEIELEVPALPDDGEHVKDMKRRGGQEEEEDDDDDDDVGDGLSTACRSRIRFDPRAVLMLDFYSLGRSSEGRDAVELCLEITLRRFNIPDTAFLLKAVHGPELSKETVAAAAAAAAASQTKNGKDVSPEPNENRQQQELDLASQDAGIDMKRAESLKGLVAELIGEKEMPQNEEELKKEIADAADLLQSLEESKKKKES